MRTKLLLLSFFLLLVLACSSSSSPSGIGTPCGSDPTMCKPGTTCWPADSPSMPVLRCLASQPANGFAAACMQIIGQPQCGDGLTCDQINSGAGECTYYCNGARQCPTGYSCHITTVTGGQQIEICRPGSPPPPGDDGGSADGDDGGLIDDANEVDAIYIPDGSSGDVANMM